MIAFQNQTTYSFVNNLSSLLSSLTNRTLSLQYEFSAQLDGDSSHNKYIEDLVSFNSFGCSCLRDCNGGVNQEANLFSKVFDINFDYIINEAFIDPFITSSYGVNQIFSYVESISNFSNDTIQFGGGSGFGFQLYCDSKLILTYGGGGGGGVYSNHSSNDINFGGGGGSGLQIRDPFFNMSTILSEHFISVGSGGGCGTAYHQDVMYNLFELNSSSSHNARINDIVCGFTLDEDSSDEFKLLKVLNFWRSDPLGFANCKSISVDGGGGGGGGSSSCCYPSSTSFGFNFNLQSTGSKDFPPLLESVSSINNTRDSQDYFNSTDLYRNKYDVLGYILNSQSELCGGFSWCCICNNSQELFRNCRVNYSSSLLCDIIQSHNTSLSWLDKTTCCGNNNNKSSNNGQIKDISTYKIPEDYFYLMDISTTNSSLLQTFSIYLNKKELSSKCNFDASKELLNWKNISQIRFKSFPADPLNKSNECIYFLPNKQLDIISTKSNLTLLFRSSSPLSNSNQLSFVFGGILFVFIFIVILFYFLFKYFKPILKDNHYPPDNHFFSFFLCRNNPYEYHPIR